jgi:Rod binding domain-containing protein
MQNISTVSQIPSIAPKLDNTQLSEKELYKLWDAAKQLEATFSGFLLKELKMGTSQPGGEESFAADVYGDMFKRSLAEQLSRSGSLGIAKQIYQDASKLADKAAGMPASPPTLSPATLRFQPERSA